MTRLPIVSARECIRALEKAGFYISHQKGSHITMRRDDPPAKTVLPNHKTLKKGMLKRILKDAGLTVEEFADLL
jgi:predicted RNA binding protein YcfA (HicA-like mRNA interferase family)